MLADIRSQRIVLQLTDSLLGGLALIIAYLLRTKLALHLPYLSQLPNIGNLTNYIVFLPVIIPLTPIILYRLNFYSLSTNQNRATILNLCFQASIILFLILVVLQFFLKIQLGRSVFVLFVPCFSLLIYSREILHQFILSRMAKSGKAFRNLIIISDEAAHTSWGNSFKAHPEYGFRLIEQINLNDLSLEKFTEKLHRHAIHLVIFDVKEGRLEKISQAIKLCELEGIEAWFSARFFQTSIATAIVDYFEGEPLLIFRSTPDSSWQLIFKEALDRIGAATLLIITSPIFIIASLLIKFNSKGPIFFKQERSGHYGRPFTMYKFRSMVVDAEELQEKLKQQNEMSGPVFKISNDPRITPLGHVLRKTSVDELPQLINVLKGEMSLVGPRPLPVYETSAISENAQRRRLSVKPGITCLWQITGRNEVKNFEEWVKLDLKYIDNWSFWLDLKILFLTIPVVFIGKGAK